MPHPGRRAILTSSSAVSTWLVDYHPYVVANPSEPLTLRGLSAARAWDYENGFYWFAPKSRLYKLLAHYELYRSIIDVPGDVVELGVYKAASLIRLAAFRDLLENEYSRRVIGFDAFGAFPRESLSVESDQRFIDHWESQGGDGLSLTEATEVIRRKPLSNIVLREGNVFDTIPRFLDEFPSTRIALLHLDMDVKEPTEFALNQLYERVVPGGLIVLDDYGAVAGATVAVDSFLVDKHLKIEKLNYYSVPGFVRKPL